MSQSQNPRRRLRCAVYTRKSTEEGLEMQFNSLDAQREAAEAYIASQRHEGWMLVPDYYDDGGYSGGNMERPALKRLLDDIRAGEVDVIVVYKVDRLSRSLAGRLCFQWCKGQPQAFSEKTNKPDTRGAYGLHGQEMIAWLTHLQHARGKNVWFVGILDEKIDEFNRRFYAPQIDGSKTGLELPGIVDQMITMAAIPGENGEQHRAFVCRTLNPYGYPAKDRSGRLEMLEEPHLGKLMAKVRQPLERRLSWNAPPTAA